MGRTTSLTLYWAVFSFFFLATTLQVSSAPACQQRQDAKADETELGLLYAFPSLELSDDNVEMLISPMACCEEVILQPGGGMESCERKLMQLRKGGEIVPLFVYSEMPPPISPEIMGKVAFIAKPTGEPPAMKHFLRTVRLYPSELYLTAEQRKNLRKLESSYFDALFGFMKRTEMEAVDIVPLQVRINLLEGRTNRVIYHLLKPIQRTFFRHRLWRDVTSRTWDYEFFRPDGLGHALHFRCPCGNEGFRSKSHHRHSQKREEHPQYVGEHP